MMAISCSNEEQLNLIAAFPCTEPPVFHPNAMCGDINVQAYSPLHATSIQASYSGNHEAWVAQDLTASTHTQQEDFNSTFQMPWNHSTFNSTPMSLISSPGMKSTIPAADASPGLMSSPETAVSSRCHTPMDNWGLDEQNDLIDPNIQAPVTPNPSYWCDMVTCGAEQFIPSVTAYSQFSPAISNISPPVMPFTQKVEGPEIYKIGEGSKTATGLLHSLNSSSRQSSPAETLEQKMRSMEEKTKLVRQRNPRKTSLKDKPTCPLCSKTFSRPHNLKSHLENHKSTLTPRPFPCDECDQSFKRTADLIRHQESIHSKQKRFICDVCESSFPRKDTLRRHFQVSCLKNMERRQYKNRKSSRARGWAASASSQSSTTKLLSKSSDERTTFQGFEFQQDSS